ncbi:MAG TPA: DUF3365 domain-containing protein [Candidatus Hydrogenedentes bacterium]|mgnify:CR=1 FL=1|nr:DUF3365 domain-containing protein [Candidatus Hydrogenedentota bacterium]
MDQETNRNRDYVRIRFYVIAAVLGWSGILGGSFLWNVYQGKQEILSMARIQAQVAHQRDVIYRRWNAESGGIYAPVSQKITPNPYLKIPNRDITDQTGRPLTLVNPAYMTRQAHELAESAYGIHGHITSLNPIRKENAPDPWETNALRAFEKGQKEVSAVETMGNAQYMRLMRPLMVEDSCLKCHASQGYKIGDVRGGISVAVPMEPLWTLEKARKIRLAGGHTVIWLAGMIGILAGAIRLRAQIRHKKKAEDQVRESEAQLRVVNQQLEEAKDLLEEHNRLLEERVRERTKELHDSRLEIVRRLARAAEFRDTDTGLHITRMSLYCEALGRAAGLNEMECDLLLNSSALHDIGKIGIPDRILLKHGRFEPDEAKVIKRHVEMGGEILAQSASELVQWAEVITRAHHEKWDGTGYPAGLKGEEIPLIGRIATLCDVFDALTSQRPYKKAWSVEEAIAEIERGRGIHFDPQLVDLFKQALPKILKIRDTYNETVEEGEHQGENSPVQE